MKWSEWLCHVNDFFHRWKYKYMKVHFINFHLQVKSCHNYPQLLKQKGPNSKMGNKITNWKGIAFMARLRGQMWLHALRQFVVIILRCIKYTLNRNIYCYSSNLVILTKIDSVLKVIGSSKWCSKLNSARQLWDGVHMQKCKNHLSESPSRHILWFYFWTLKCISTL